MRRLLGLLAALAVCLSAGSVSAGPLARIYIEPGCFGLRTGLTQQLKVTGTDVMGNIVPVTEAITWSADPSVGTISENGVFRAGGVSAFNPAGVTARTASGSSAVAIVEVVAPTLNDPLNGYSFDCSWGGPAPGRVCPATDLGVDSRGIVYVASSTIGCVQKFDSSGNYAGQLGAYVTRPAPPSSPGAMCIGRDDNVYIGSGSVYKYSPSGALLGSGGPTIQWIADIAVGPSGSVYVADTYGYGVQKLDSNLRFVCRWGSQGTGAGQFQFLRGIVVDSSENVYVLDSGPNVQKFTSRGEYLATWTDIDHADEIDIDAHDVLYLIGSGVHKFDTSGNRIGEVNAGMDLAKLAIDSAGYIFAINKFSDLHCFNGISKLTPTGSVVAAWGQHTPGQIVAPKGLAVAAEGSIWIADEDYYGRGVVRKYTSQWDLVSTLPEAPGSNQSSALPDCLALDGSGGLYVGYVFAPVTRWDSAGNILAQLTGQQRTSGVAVGANGDVYIAAQDDINYRDGWVDRRSPTGTLLGTWNSAGPGGAKLTWIGQVAVGNGGSVYVAGGEDQYVCKYDSAGQYVSRFGGYGSSPGNLNMPYGVATDSVGNVFVTDMSQGVQKFTANGVFLSKIGSGCGSAAIGRFNYPQGVTVDSSGRVFISDTQNNRVQRWSPPPTPTPLGQAKSSADGSFMVVTDMVVTANFGDYFYVESADRSCGIRVSRAVGGAYVGKTVAVCGAVTTVNGEKRLNASAVSILGAGSVDPLLMTNRDLGGGDWNYDSSTGAGQKGVVDAAGPNNIGLLVKTTGKVTGIGTDFFYIDDGTHATDGSIYNGVRVFSNGYYTPTLGQQLAVTGISSISRIGEELFRSLRVRTQADIQTF